MMGQVGGFVRLRSPKQASRAQPMPSPWLVRLVSWGLQFSKLQVTVLFEAITGIFWDRKSNRLQWQPLCKFKSALC